MEMTDPIAVFTALFLGVAVLLLSLQVRRTHLRDRAAMAVLQGDLRALCGAAVAMGERVNGLERQLRQVAQRQEELGLRQEQLGAEESDGRSFEQAIKLAQRGAAVDELADICGLTRGEAELIAMMHRLDKAG